MPPTRRACITVRRDPLCRINGITATGLVISTRLDLTLPDYTAWLSVHSAVSIATLLALVPAGGKSASRREFLEVMGAAALNK